MHPLGTFLTRHDRIAASRSDEAWRAWHRRPDAHPLPDLPVSPSIGDRLSMAVRTTFVRTARV